jgi:hypothetical protein
MQLLQTKQTSGDGATKWFCDAEKPGYLIYSAAMVANVVRCDFARAQPGE